MPEPKLTKRDKPTKWQVEFRCQFRHRHREIVQSTKTDARTIEAERKAEVWRARHGMADAYVCELVAEKEAGLTFCEFVPVFLERHGDQTGSTYYREALKEGRDVAEHFGAMHLREITERDVQWFARMRAKKVSASTVRKDLTLLGTIFRRARRWRDDDGDRYMEHDPTLDVEKPRECEPSARALTPAEFKRIREAISSERDRALAGFLLFTSARWAEVARLKWDDVNQDDGFATFRQQKGGRWSTKRVALGTKALAALPTERESEYVFVDGKGRHYDDRWRRPEFCSRFKDACRRAKVPWASLKALRTTFATWAEEEGVPVETTQRALGHASVQTTQRFYTRSQADKTRAAVEAVERKSGLDLDSPTLSANRAG